jgi:predicted dehydrogenase
MAALRVGIVGTGSMGSAHAAAWAHTPATIAGYVTRSADRAAGLVGRYGGRLYPELEAMLAEIDVLDVCSPTHLHHQATLKAAQAGVDVVCEKPLARTAAQGREMIVACRAAGIKLLVAHVVRYFPEYALARQLVSAGEIGRPAIIRLSRGTFQPRKAAGNWFVDPAKSGGMMLDLMIHDLDYARWLAGEVESVYARKISSGHPEAADHGLAILKHAGGALSHVEASWAYPAPLFRTRFEIAGSEGWLEFDSGRMAAIGMHLRGRGERGPEVPRPASPLIEDPYVAQIRAFYRALIGEEPIPIGGEDGLAALEIALAAIESAESGEVVHLGARPA